LRQRRDRAAAAAEGRVQRSGRVEACETEPAALDLGGDDDLPVGLHHRRVSLGLATEAFEHDAAGSEGRIGSAVGLVARDGGALVDRGNRNDLASGCRTTSRISPSTGTTPPVPNVGSKKLAASADELVTSATSRTRRRWVDAFGAASSCTP
jgi:hypothetical protein